VSKPRLRRKGGGQGAELAVPAYAAMRCDESLRERLLSIVMRGVSTRHYQEVVPELAERCGVSRSAVVNSRPMCSPGRRLMGTTSC
jgi:hypothetical protein